MKDRTSREASSLYHEGHEEHEEGMSIDHHTDRGDRVPFKFFVFFMVMRLYVGAG